VNIYQHGFFLPGPLFGAIMLAGLAGILIPSRRSPAAILLWASAVIIMVVPTAEHEYTYRYVLPAVPLACMALALAFRKPIGRRRAVGQQEAGGAADPDADAGATAPLPAGQAADSAADPAERVTAAQVADADPQTA